MDDTIRREVLFTETQVIKAIDQLAARLNARFAGTEPLLMCLMNGGVMLSAAIMQRLHVPVRFDYMHLSRYRNGTRGGEIEWIVRPRASVSGQTVLLVDDICDHGLTLESAIRTVLDAGAREVVTVVLVERRGTPSSVSPDFAALECGPGFLVGWGMDYQGFDRNLRTIYTLEFDKSGSHT